MNSNKAVVLCSGGFDSVVMLSDIVKSPEYEPHNIYVLFFDYGQRNVVQERTCVESLINKLGIPPANTLGMSLPPFTWCNSSLIYTGVAEETSLHSQYVPMRNLIFFSYAMSYAQSIGCNTIYSAILGEGTYADTNAEFLAQVKDMASKIGIDFRFPFSGFTKYGLAGLARWLGVTSEDFFSCNTPINGRPCGECDDCKILEYINNVYLEDNYPTQIITRNDFKPNARFRKSYRKYPLEEVRMLINNSCNTQCSHCFYGFKDMKADELTLDEWKNVIVQSAEINPKMNFHFSGKEPLFDEKIFALVDFIDSLNLKYGYSLTYDMVTNGINIPKYIDNIVERNFTRVALSVDYVGCTRSFGGVEDVINLLVSNKIPVHCFIVAHKDNVEHIPEMVQHLYELGVHNFFIKDVINIGRGSDMDLLSTSQYSALYDQIINYFTGDGVPNDIEIIFYVKGRHFWKLIDECDTQLALDLDLWKNTLDEFVYETVLLRPEFTCSRYLTQISVTPDGYVLGCGTELANPDYPKYSSGRLFEDGTLDQLINIGRDTALKSIEESSCRNNYVCFHKIRK